MRMLRDSPQGEKKKEMDNAERRGDECNNRQERVVRGANREMEAKLYRHRERKRRVISLIYQPSSFWDEWEGSCLWPGGLNAPHCTLCLWLGENLKMKCNNNKNANRNEKNKDCFHFQFNRPLDRRAKTIILQSPFVVINLYVRSWGAPFCLAQTSTAYCCSSQTHISKAITVIACYSSSDFPCALCLPVKQALNLSSHRGVTAAVINTYSSSPLFCVVRKWHISDLTNWYE